MPTIDGPPENDLFGFERAPGAHSIADEFLRFRIRWSVEHRAPKKAGKTGSHRSWILYIQIVTRITLLPDQDLQIGSPLLKIGTYRSGPCAASTDSHARIRTHANRTHTNRTHADRTHADRTHADRTHAFASGMHAPRYLLMAGLHQAVARGDRGRAKTRVSIGATRTLATPGCLCPRAVRR